MSKHVGKGAARVSRADAERRVWRETQADWFTGFDRRLLAAADTERLVEDRGGLKKANPASRLLAGSMVELSGVEPLTS